MLDGFAQRAWLRCIPAPSYCSSRSVSPWLCSVTSNRLRQVPATLVFQPFRSVRSGPGQTSRGIGETEAAGVSVVLDEHLLTDPQRDMDYNGGGEVTFSGTRAKVRWLDWMLGGIDGALGTMTSRRAEFGAEA